MNTALAQLLTTALVQFVDKNQPKDKMDVSSIEAEELERCFTEEKFNRVEDWYAFRMKPELTEFEEKLVSFAIQCEGEWNTANEEAKKWPNELLALAKNELLSYADESNPAIEAIEAMADLERAVTCGNVDNIPKWLQEELNKAFKKGQEAAKRLYDSLQQEQPPLPANLDEATETYSKEVSNGHSYRDLICGFKAGAKWQKSQMLKDAVEGRVFMSFAPGHNQMVMADVDLPTNTKVRIVVLKEEE